MPCYGHEIHWTNASRSGRLLAPFAVWLLGSEVRGLTRSSPLLSSGSPLNFPLLSRGRSAMRAAEEARQAAEARAAQEQTARAAAETLAALETAKAVEAEASVRCGAPRRRENPLL